MYGDAVDVFLFALILFDGMDTCWPRELVFNLNALLQLAHILGGEWFGGCDLILFLVLVAWVRQLVCQVTIVCEDEQPGAVFVQSAHRVETGVAVFLREQVYHGRATTVVLGGRDDSPRFVHHEIDTLRSEEANLLAGYGDSVMVDVNGFHE